MMNENVELLQNESAEEYLQNVTQFIEDNLGKGHLIKESAKFLRHCCLVLKSH